MDPINAQAFARLEATVRSLLPPPPTAALAPEVTVNPVRVGGTGLAGFVGLAREPDGEVVGRLVEAKTVVTVKRQTVDALDDAVAQVTQALVGAAEADLRSGGILRLELEQLGTPFDPPGPTVNQGVVFDVSYEFLKRPEEAGDTIAEIPLDVDLDGAGVRTIVDATFEVGSLDWFEIVDDPGANKNRPSSWAYEAAEERIEQRSSIHGGAPAALTPNKPGTYLVLRETPSRPPVADLILKSELRSEGPHGIGLVFRFRDVDNFYFFLMNRSGGYRMLGKKVGGVFAALETPALDATQGFEEDRTYRAKVVARGPDLRVFLDEEPVLRGADAQLAAPGRVGFLAYRNPEASFHNLVLKEV